MIRGFV